jgi:hypothetical protein
MDRITHACVLSDVLLANFDRYDSRDDAVRIMEATRLVPFDYDTDLLEEYVRPRLPPTQARELDDFCDELRRHDAQEVIPKRRIGGRSPSLNVGDTFIQRSSGELCVVIGWDYVQRVVSESDVGQTDGIFLALTQIVQLGRHFDRVARYTNGVVKFFMSAELRRQYPDDE